MQGVLPSRRAQPSHLLKFRNKAFGFDTPGPRAKAEAQMDGAVKEKKRKSEGRIEGVKRKRVKP